MNPPDDDSLKPVDATTATPAPSTNPHLTAHLRADYDAIRNDLEQAKQLAADFQRQVSDKSNEVAHIKLLLEKTTGDLGRLEQHVGELRQERHRLANDLMVAAAVELELGKVKKERDQLRLQVETLQKATMKRIGDLQAQVTQQEEEIANLERGRSTAPAPAPRPQAAPENDRIAELTATVTRLMQLVEGNTRGKNVPTSGPTNESDDDFINISFSR